MKTLIIAVLVGFAAATVPLSHGADEKPAVEKKSAAPRALPFGGKVAAVDKQAKTVTVGKRTFHVTPDTRIMKAGKPATLEDATVGETVGGSYREGEDKKLNLVSLRIGPRPEAPKKEDKNEAK
jgi:hypothetical protein